MIKCEKVSLHNCDVLLLFSRKNCNLNHNCLGLLDRGLPARSWLYSLNKQLKLTDIHQTRLVTYFAMHRKWVKILLQISIFVICTSDVMKDCIENALKSIGNPELYIRRNVSGFRINIKGQYPIIRKWWQCFVTC